MSPDKAPWAFLLKNADDGSFLDLTGFSREAFKRLVRLLELPEERQARLNCVRPCGRPCLLDFPAKVGVLLFYLNSKMAAKNMAFIFGVLPQTINSTVNLMLARCVDRLKKCPEARVRLPDAVRMAEYAEMVHRRENLVDDVIGFLDGVSLLTRATPASTPSRRALASRANLRRPPPPGIMRCGRTSLFLPSSPQVYYHIYSALALKLVYIYL
jgi:hypothetical protein